MMSRRLECHGIGETNRQGTHARGIPLTFHDEKSSCKTLAVLTVDPQTTVVPPVSGDAESRASAFNAFLLPEGEIRRYTCGVADEKPNDGRHVGPLTVVGASPPANDGCPRSAETGDSSMLSCRPLTGRLGSQSIDGS
jgi:hypothetical protein